MMSGTLLRWAARLHMLVKILKAESVSRSYQSPRFIMVWFLEFLDDTGNTAK